MNFIFNTFSLQIFTVTRTVHHSSDFISDIWEFHLRLYCSTKQEFKSEIIQLQYHFRDTNAERCASTLNDSLLNLFLNKTLVISHSLDQS